MPRIPALCLLLFAASLAHGGDQPTPSSRQAEVAAAGRTVMPFDLDATMHHFVKAPNGGVQRVVAKQAGDATEIASIRSHLAGIAAAFARRDFGDPRAIHGEAMPGLATLESASAEALRIEYADRPDGAEIRYASADPAIVEALHLWFDAQVSDHGHHASHH